MSPPRLSKLVWLKRTHGHPLTPAEFRVLVSIFNDSGSDGRNAHPGIARMIEETGYRRTGVSEAVSGLRAKGWIHQTYRGNGNTGKASIFDLVPDAPNPSYRCPEDRAGKCSECSHSSAIPEQKAGGHSSARAEQRGSHSSGQAVQDPGETGSIVPLRRTPSDLLADLLASPAGKPPDLPQSSGNDHRNRDPFAGPADPLSLRSDEGPKAPGGEDDRGDERSPRESEGEPEPKNRNEGDGPPGLLGLGKLGPDPLELPDSGDPTDPFSVAFVPNAATA
jgi:hypothetical protein